jgi:hypothetical protein
MTLTKLGFFGEVKWDFLIYLARIYKNLGFKVGLLDASLEKKLGYFLPKDLAIEIIDYDDMTHFLSYFDGCEVTDFDFLLINIGFNSSGVHRLLATDQQYLMTNYNRKAIETSHALLLEISKVSEDFTYHQIFIDYISSVIKKKYINYTLSKNHNLKIRNTYYLGIHENILKGRLSLQHKAAKKTIKIPKDYYQLYQDMILDTCQSSKRAIKKAYKKSRKGC